MACAKKCGGKKSTAKAPKKSTGNKYACGGNKYACGGKKK